MNIFKALTRLSRLVALAQDIPEAYTANVALYRHVEALLAHDSEGKRLLDKAEKENFDVVQDALAILGKGE